MAYSVGVEYALHSLVYLVDPPVKRPIGIKELAAFQGLSESYLSKIFTKLVKAGLVQSIPGVKGGYELAKDPDRISFLDVVEAIEGTHPLFQCRNIIANFAIRVDNLEPETAPNAGTVRCQIHRTMLEAEQQMRQYLKRKTLLWLKNRLKQELPAEIHEQTESWFRSRLR